MRKKDNEDVNKKILQAESAGFSLFGGDLGEVVDNQVRDQLGPIRITKQAKAKADYVSRRVCELLRGGHEIGFYLTATNPNGSDHTVVSDIYVGHDQTVTPTHCDISPLGNVRSFRDIRDTQKRRVIGWGHSHANFTTFFSKEDKGTITDVLKNQAIKRDVNLETELTSQVTSINFVRSEGGTGLQLQLKDRLPVTIYSPLFNIIDVEGARKIPFGLFRGGVVSVPYVYGMTFNQKDDEPHCVIAYLFGGEPRIVEAVGLEIAGDPYVAPYDEIEMDMQLFERVKNLQQSAEQVRREVGDDLKQAKEDSYRCQEINSELANATLDSLSYYPSKYLAILLDFSERESRVAGLVETYTKESWVRRLLTEKELRQINAIGQEHQRMGRMVFSQKEHYEAMHQELGKAIESCRSLWDKRWRGELLQLQEGIAQIIQVGSDYLIQHGGYGDDRKPES